MILSYNAIVEIAREIIDNENIPSDRLLMVYTLPAKQHLKLNEDLFYNINGPKAEFEPSDLIEIEIAGIKFRIEIEKELTEDLDIK